MRGPGVILRRMKWCALLLVGVVGCGGQVATTSDAGTSSDAGASSDASSDSWFDPPPPTTDGGPCNALALLGDTITVNDMAAEFPTSGTADVPPLPGTYVLETSTRYTGTGGSSGPHGTLSVTVQVTPSAWQVAVSDKGGPVDHRTYGLNLATPDGPYRLNCTCGTTDTKLVTFVPINSPGFVLVIFDKNAGVTIVDLFRPVQK